jgi:hypothetical protein
MALTCWDAEELLEELVGGVDDDGQGEEQVNHKEDLRRSFHLHQTHLQAAFLKAKILKKIKMSFDVLLVQRTARRLCWLPPGCNLNKSVESHLYSLFKNERDSPPKYYN